MRIDNYYLYFEENDNIKNKRITGTTIADLMGINKWKTKGDCLLNMFGIIVEPFDEYYTKRGALAEKLALKSLEKRGHKCTIYNAQEIGWNNFPNNKNNLGGVIDIELIEENTLYEIKSKSMKDYEEIFKNGNIVQEHQAIHYGLLRDYDKVHIMWIFFDEQTEYEIKNNLPITTFKNLKMFEKELIVDKYKLAPAYKEVITLYNDCYNYRRIPLNLISDKYLKQLGFERPKSDLDLLIDDLPF